MAKSPSQRSSGLFPVTGNDFDEAAALQIGLAYSLPVGCASAKTIQLNVAADFAAQSDEVIIQYQRNGTTANLVLGYEEFSRGSFVPGFYRTAVQIRGFGLEGLRIGLSSTATAIEASVSAVY